MILQKLKHFFANDIDEYLTFLSLIILVIVTIVSVFCRYILNSPIIWGGEATQISLTWYICMGMSTITKDRLHINIDVFRKHMPNRVAVIFTMIGELEVMIVLSLFIYYGGRLILLSKSNYFNILNIPRSVSYFALPLGSLFMLIRSIRYFVNELPKFLDIFHSQKKLDNEQ